MGIHNTSSFSADGAHDNIVSQSRSGNRRARKYRPFERTNERTNRSTLASGVTIMAAMLGGGDGMPLEQWFFEMPVCTRWWTTATVITGVLVQCEILNPFQLFYIFFIQRYARMLEEAAPTRAHFAWLLAYASTTLLAIAPLFNQGFLGTTLSSTLVYIWSRRNPDTRLSF